MYIQNRNYFLVSLMIVGIIIYLMFKVFNYYYIANYCDFLSKTVEHESADEIIAMKKCVDMPFCKIGDIFIPNESNMKEFTCIRTIKPGIWKQ